jgi:hypothetical protein
MLVQNKKPGLKAQNKKLRLKTEKSDSNVCPVGRCGRNCPRL